MSISDSNSNIHILLLILCNMRPLQCDQCFGLSPLDPIHILNKSILNGGLKYETSQEITLFGGLISTIK